MIGPAYVDIEVQGQVHPYPGYTAQDAIDSANAMMEVWLNPDNYGGSPTSTSGKEWSNDPTLRHDEAVDYANRGAGVWWTQGIQMRVVGGAWTAGDGGGSV